MSVPQRKKSPGNAARQQAPREPLHSLARLWLREVQMAVQKGIAQLEDRSSPMPRRIRKGRRATKAARALLRLAPEGLRRQSRGLIMALSSVRRLLSSTRDADALLETLQAVAVDAALSPRAMTAVARPLKVRQPVMRGAQADECARAVAALRKILSQVQSWPVPRGRGAMILDALGDDHRRLMRDCKPGLDKLDPEDLHALRKRIITHRHQLALLVPYVEAADTGKIVKRIERAKALQKVIGAHRDLYLLAEHLRARAEPATHAARQKLIEAIAKRQKAALKDAVELSAKLNRQKPKAVLKPARKRMG